MAWHARHDAPLDLALDAGELLAATSHALADGLRAAAEGREGDARWTAWALRQALRELRRVIAEGEGERVVTARVDVAREGSDEG